MCRAPSISRGFLAAGKCSDGSPDLPLRSAMQAGSLMHGKEASRHGGYLLLISDESIPARQSLALNSGLADKFWWVKKFTRAVR
jgi:hypothetical protein